MTAVEILQPLERRWRWYRLGEQALWALALALPFGVLLASFGLSGGYLLLLYVLSFALLSLFRPFWKISQKALVQQLNLQISDAEWSTELLLQAEEQLNVLERLQKEKILKQMAAQAALVKPPHRLAQFGRYLGFSALLSLLLWGAPRLLPQGLPKNMLSLTKADSLAMPKLPPFVRSWRLDVVPPAYTGLPRQSSQAGSVSVFENSLLSWHVQGDSSLKAVVLHWQQGDSLVFGRETEGFVLRRSVAKPALYTLAFHQTEGISTTEVFRIEVQKDAAPAIQVALPKSNFVEISVGESQRFDLQARISDDFLVQEVKIAATVASGSGEGVKFREVQIPLAVQVNQKNVNVRSKVSLSQLGMTWGDELYFYLEARDNKPQAQWSRSETFIVMLEDTTSADFLEDMGLGVNRMPDYFRSQRQIIIDTEKLIAQRKSLKPEVFEERSNDLGIDQKLLRLRYGQFLGEEFESQAGGNIVLDEHEHHHHDEEEGKGFAETILEKYGHAHDHEHEHHHGQDSPSESIESLLEEYRHVHDDGEINTFLQAASRALLKKALEEMWQAELHLRLHEPEKALPYEVKALKYLKQVQQKSRIYLKKAGIENLPPIKEQEKRFSGEQEAIVGPRYVREQSAERPYPSIQAAYPWAELYSRKAPAKIAPEADAALAAAVQDLAEAYLQHPERAILAEGLSALQALRQGKACKGCWQKVRLAFLQALPPPPALPEQKSLVEHPLLRQYYQTVP
jgi:hypothetical protein